MRKIVLGITTLLALSLTLAAIGIIGYRVVLAANSRPTPAKSSYYPSDWHALTAVPVPSPTIPFGMTWQRTGDLVGACGELSLLDTAESRYSACGQPSVLAELTPEEYRQYLYYLSHYAPFAYSLASIGGSSEWLWFGGRGENQATPSEQSIIATWTEGVYLRLWQEERQAGIVAAVRLTLAARLRISADEITTEYVEPVDWPNACLGLYLPGLDCANVRTSGYQVILIVNGVRYEYRTNLYDIYRLAGSTVLTPTPLPATATPIPPTPQTMPTVVPSPTASPTLKPSATATNSPTTTPHPKATASPTATTNPTSTSSPTASPTATPSPTVTMSPTATSSPTVTPSPTASVLPTATPSPTATPNPTATIVPTSTARPTASSPTVTPDLKATPTATTTTTPDASPTPGARIDQTN